MQFHKASKFFSEGSRANLKEQMAWIVMGSFVVSSSC